MNGSPAGGSSLPVIAVTAGEPAGIGPDLCAMLTMAQRAVLQSRARLVIIADRGLIETRARQIGLEAAIPDAAAFPAAPLSVLHVPLRVPCRPGAPDPANSAYVVATLAAASDGCLRGHFDAMVTAPVHKAVINEAGVPFTGHTEFLAERTGVSRVVMMLAGGGLRVALATTHLPLSGVAPAISRQGLFETLSIIDRDLRQRFGVAQPRILVAGLNPHAGEGGHLGREEIDVIAPAIADAQAAGIDALGPIPADTLFVPARLAGADCVLAMFHDQGLPVLKYASFGVGINVTLGLPIIRTSVDHGTALDIAGTGRAEDGSLVEAINVAIAMAAARGRIRV
jgi:4-hydroxythreonine-4-phosphate dehydrogenase